MAVVDWLVAAGTLALAAAAFVQMLLSRRAEKRVLERELAERIYNPIRRELLSWAHPKWAFSGVIHATVDLGGRKVPESWPDLDQEMSYLTRHVPTKLRERLQTAHEIKARTRHDWSTMVPLVTQEIERRGGEVRNQPGRRDNVYIAVNNGANQGFEVDVLAVWMSGKTLGEWVEWQAGEAHLLGPWELELHIEGKRHGGAAEAAAFVDEVMTVVAKDEVAHRLRAGYGSLMELRAQLLAEVERRLGLPRANMAFTGP